MYELDEEEPHGAAKASHRHAVHEQHSHEVKPPTLASCTHEFGASLVLLYGASVALAAMVVHFVREFVVRGRTPQRRVTKPGV